MSLQTAGDLPLQITSENSSSERRITPSWTIGQLKAKLEPVTGIPPLSQKLTLKIGGRDPITIQAIDEEHTQLVNFPLAPYAEIHVSIKFYILFQVASRKKMILWGIFRKIAYDCGTVSSQGSGSWNDCQVYPARHTETLALFPLFSLLRLQFDTSRLVGKRTVQDLA